MEGVNVLVLTRRVVADSRQADVWLYVAGEWVQIRVINVDRNQVRLGISAPANVNIVRGELVPERYAEGRG